MRNDAQSTTPRRPLTAGLLALCLLAAGGARATSLETLWKAARDGRYRAPSAAELRQATALFRRELAGDPAPGLRRDWRALGWERHTLKLGNQNCRVLYEAAGRREGRGFYLFCPRAAGCAVLQAPHSFKDLHTGRIALALAGKGRFRATAWNTVPRYSEDAQGRRDADLAHLPESYFTALARAVAEHADSGPLIQLHGFSRAARRDDGRDAHIILSNGTRRPGTRILELAGRLRQAFGLDTRVYPLDIQELGALTNRQGQVMRAAGRDDFVHIELSLELRRRLREDAAARARFARALPGRCGGDP